MSRPVIGTQQYYPYAWMYPKGHPKYRPHVLSEEDKKRLDKANPFYAPQGGMGREESERYAIFADVAYKKKMSEKREMLDKYNKNGWIVDEALTNNDATTLRNEGRKETIVAIRGTDPRNVGDLWTDVGILLGTTKRRRRYNEIYALVENAISKYGREGLTLTGHSLGGELARLVGETLNIRSVVFNKGSSYKDIVASDKHMKHYTTNKPTAISIDPISLTGAYANGSEYIPAKSWNTHSLSNFLGDPADQAGEGVVWDKVKSVGKTALKMGAVAMAAAALGMASGKAAEIISNALENPANNYGPIGNKLVDLYMKYVEGEGPVDAGFRGIERFGNKWLGSGGKYGPIKKSIKHSKVLINYDKDWGYSTVAHGGLVRPY